MTTVEPRRTFAADVISHVELADDEPVKFSQQEGGRTIISGTFSPQGTTVKLEVSISGRFDGWGAGGVDLHMGIIDSPTDPWEPGGKNQITEGNFAGRGPLPGVRPGSYRHVGCGFLSGGDTTPHIGRIVVLEDLDPEQTYNWELRCGGASFYKWVNFAKGARPTSLAVSPDNLHVWALLSGTNKLALVQIGWSPQWARSGHAPDMLCVAEIPLPGRAGGIAPQPIPQSHFDPSAIPFPVSRGQYVALIDDAHHELVLVDQEKLAVDGSYPLPDDAVPSAKRVLWDRFGEKIYVGGANDGRLYRFDLGSRTFDQHIELDGEPGADIVPLAVLFTAQLDEAAHSLWCSSVSHGRIIQVDLDSWTSRVFHQYGDGLTAPLCGVARHTTGGIVVVDSNDRVRCFDSEGRSSSSWKAALDEAEVKNLWTSICLDDDEIRAFWSIDDIFGWAWIDGSHEIETRPNGRDWIGEVVPNFPQAGREKRVINKSRLSQFYKTDFYGDVANTESEGTLLAIPDEDCLIHWPGGAVQIRPGPWAPQIWGTEHASITFTGAEATGA